MTSRLSVEEHNKLLKAERKALDEKKRQVRQERRDFISKSQRWTEDFERTRQELEQREADLLEEEELLRNLEQNMAAGGGSCFGSVKKFNVQDDWSLWCERLEQYLFANDVPNAKRVTLLLTLLGTEGYSLMRNLCSPELPSTKTFDQLKVIMENHLQPKPNIIMERYRFKECRQKGGVNVKEYIAQLKKLSSDCAFEANLEDCLRDQFVWGFRSDAIKKKLLGEQDPSYNRAIQIAAAMEAATRDVAEMGPSSRNTESSINFVGNKEKRLSKFKSSVKNLCLCCGRSNHSTDQCKFRKYSCHVCHAEGHLASVCKNKNKTESFPKRSGDKNNNNEGQLGTKGKNERHHYVDEVSEFEQTFDNVFCLREDSAHDLLVESVEISDEPILIDLRVQGEQLKFEIDTGSPITAMSVKDFNRSDSLSKLTLLATENKFKSHAGHTIIPEGLVKVEVALKGRKKVLEIFILPGQGPPIVGRLWIRVLKIAAPGIGEISLGKFSLHLKKDAQPVYHEAQPIPYALRERVEKELDRLISEKIIVPVESSQWATPIVPVLKSNGQIRICGDYKFTVNPYLKIDRHPIPRVQDLLATLNGGKVFSKLDLSNAYLQVELDEKSQKLVTISTHKGLFKYKRLCFGVASAPDLFQREIERILQGIDGVVCFFNDILVSVVTADEHLERLRKVLNHFRDCGLTVRGKKCAFFCDSVTFLGYVINAQGSTVAREEVQAISDVPTPHNVTQLKAFLGMLNYYSKFIKNYATILNPLCELLRSGSEWVWTRDREKAFRQAKDKLTSHEVLVNYNSSLPIKVTCDASPVGLGAVLSHIFPNGVEKPIAFASKSLTEAERNYSQLDREALGLVFGVKSFHQFVYDREFILETDHQPQIYIFGSKKGLPQMAANRVQCWAVFLSGYSFVIRHIKGDENGNADSLSRVPLPSAADDFDEELLKEYSYLNIVLENVSAIKNIDIKAASLRDRIVSKVLEYTTHGFPKTVEEELTPFKLRERELAVVDGTLMWGHRVIIPMSMRRQLLDELHSSHMGVICMKMLARSYIWWPGIDREP